MNLNSLIMIFFRCYDYVQDSNWASVVVVASQNSEHLRAGVNDVSKAIPVQVEAMLASTPSFLPLSHSFIHQTFIEHFLFTSWDPQMNKRNIVHNYPV
jgi:hypothetical protein